MNLERAEMDEDMVVFQKEKELREVVTSRIRSLVLGVQEREEEITVLRCKLTMLEKDFRYNLQLLQERDEELADYEQEFQSLQKCAAEKDGVISDLEKKLSETELSLREKESCERQLQQQFLELQRQTEFKLQQCAEEKESERERFRRQIDQLQEEFVLERNKREEMHTSAISSLEAEQAKTIDGLKQSIQFNASRIKELQGEIRILKAQGKALDREQMNTEQTFRAVTASYTKQLDTCESQLREFEKQAQTACKELDQERSLLEKYVAFVQEKIKERNIGCENVEFIAGNSQGAIQGLKQIMTELLNDISKLNQENLSLKSQLSQYLQSKDKPETAESNNAQREKEFEQLKQQNAVLRDVVKNLRRQASNTTSETNLEELRGNSRSCNSQHSEESNSKGTQHNSEIENTTPGVIQSCNCQDFKKDLEKQKEESLTQLQTLENKIDKLTHDVTERDITEESSRLQKLENTITYLKSRMLNDLKEKFEKHGDLNADKMTISDVRMMLLEQKLERITSNIGEAMSSEKECLIQAVNKIKEELALLLVENNKSEKCLKRNNDNQRKKNDEVINKLLCEVADLKATVVHNNTQEQKKQMLNKEPKERIKIIKHVPCNRQIPSHVQATTSSESNARCKTLVLNEMGMDEVWALLDEPVAQDAIKTRQYDVVTRPGRNNYADVIQK